MDFIVPKLSATMESATVLRWLKRPGDAFKQGEPIIELETDKSAMEVEAPVDGTLATILAEDGAVVAIGGLLARLEPKGGAASSASAPETAAPVPASRPAPLPAARQAASVPSYPKGERILASPLARRLALDNGIELAGLTGSGPYGRIRKRDVLAAADSRGGTPPMSLRPARAPVSAYVPAHGEATEPLSPMRSGIAEAVALSRRTIPSFALDRWVETGAIEAARTAFGREIEQATGIKPTVTDFLLQAMADTLGATPGILDRFVETDGRPLRVTPAAIDIGLVVAVPGGMMIPVLRDLKSKSLAEIARLRQAAVQRVRAGRLIAADAGPVSISLSNLGRSGVDRFEAIVSPGQTSILAAGREHERVITRAGAIVAATGVNLTFSVDHRMIDGRAGAEFLGLLADRIELGPWTNT